jgi:ATP-binding cassette subfamily C protein
MLVQFIKYLNFFFFYNRKNIYLTILFIILIFLLALLELISLALLSIFALIISNSDTTFLKKYQYNLLDINLFESENFLILIIFFFIFKNLYASFIEYFKSKFISESFVDFHKKNLKNFLENDYAKYKLINSPDFSKIINFSLERMYIGFAESLYALINETFVFFAIIILIAVATSPLIILGACILSFFYFIIFSYMKIIISQNAIKYSNNSSKIFQISSNIFDGFKEIRIFNKEREFYKFFNRHISDLGRTWFINRFFISAAKYFNELTIVCLLSLTIIFLNYINFSFKIFDITFAAFCIAIIRLYPNLTKIQNVLASINSTFPFAKEVKIFYEKSKKNSNNNRKANKIILNKKNITITLKNISFKYKDRNVLNNVNLKLYSGSKYFIYGQSGSGKTTILEVLAGLLKPSSGNVKINGIKVENINLKESNLISYVPQNPYFLNETIFNNITLFDDLNSENIAKTKKALTLSQLDYLNKNFEKNLKKTIGDKANQLSSGQKQRLSFARAIYRDSKIILMDEPTSNLDSKSEQKLMMNLFKLAKDKILIFISHNLKFYKKFDQVYLLKNSKLKKVNAKKISIIENLL